tara:strand:- start:286 stop:822 length:537 start_codon:yes stop_codon:yes gene_type:complete
MFHDWINKYPHFSEEGKKTIFNTGFYITEPMSLKMDVDWYESKTDKKRHPELLEVYELNALGRLTTDNFYIETVTMPHGVALSIHIHNLDLWNAFEGLHFYFTDLLRHFANYKELGMDWIYYNITRLSVPLEHCEAQTEYYKNNPLGVCVLCEDLPTEKQGLICKTCTNTPQQKPYTY